MLKSKAGRPRKYPEYVWFGMKITPQDREAIRRVSRRKGAPASQTIMDLVKDADKAKPSRKQITVYDVRAMSPEDRAAYYKYATKLATELYKNDPDEIWDLAEDIIDC